MTQSNHALTFKSATLYAVRVVLHEHDTQKLITSLGQRMQDAGGFFAQEPIVIDATGLSETPDWPALLAAFAQHALHVLGVCAQGTVLESALAAGLVSIDMTASKPNEASSAHRPQTIPTEPTKQAPPVEQTSRADRALGQVDTPITSQKSIEPSAALPNPQTMVVHGPLRSGQRIYARQCDLIVMGVVSQGAEVIADGNIHIYGPLRGKAMAGALGQADARIFTTSLDAELVAIAGVYRVIEGVLPLNVHRKPSMIYLKDDILIIEPLSA
jgi:septum site-determining protein MinC